MSEEPFKPTDQQKRVIEHEGSAFISACPGAGKTRVLIERAHKLFREEDSGRAIAFLSFTNAAIAELEARLRNSNLLPSPPFPHFIGTFDSFLWHFLIVPFGVPGCETAARLIPDKDSLLVQPFAKAQPLPLECFDRTSHKILFGAAKRRKFDPSRNASITKAYETSAARIRARFMASGELDFYEVRELASQRLKDPTLSPALARVLSARFRELIVDEAQDCNPADLEIINWLRRAGIATKIICDPHQSIYEFRGGVTEDLFAFEKTFEEADRLPLSGNFRSSGHICRAIVAFRAPGNRTSIDEALGKHRDEPPPVHILAYGGKSVPASVGEKFRGLMESLAIDVVDCPVLAATKQSSANAIGLPTGAVKLDLTMRLALSVTNFHFAVGIGDLKVALENLHEVFLQIGGHLDGKTYHQYLESEPMNGTNWKPVILQLAKALRYDPTAFANADEWHQRAKKLLAPHLSPGSTSISRRLPRNASLETALVQLPTSSPAARTIHSVKGMEFPGVCVVMTPNTTKSILEYLVSGAPSDQAENARKIYVGASRAQRVLAIAVPNSQVRRLEALLKSTGTVVNVTKI